ncbi:MAG: transposase [Porticoccaceae bacterium]
MYYRRARSEGGTYFFTVNLENRDSDLLVRHIDNLRAVIKQVKLRHPFSLIAMSVMPEHLHAVWRLPPGDADYPMRWALIKAGFSRTLPQREMIRDSRRRRRERGIWQRRYWEHQIRDEVDLQRHVDYIHFNPVKHGLVSEAADWPHSTLHGYVARGLVAPDWGGERVDLGAAGER